MEDLQRAVDSIAAESGFSGAVRMDRDGVVELVRAYGLAHRGHQVPNTVDTQFATASGAKGLTAVTVVSLIEDGCSLSRRRHARCSGRISRSSATT